MVWNKLKSILESLRDDVVAGKMTIKEATVELYNHGWMAFHDEEKTKRLLGV